MANVAEMITGVSAAVRSAPAAPAAPAASADPAAPAAPADPADPADPAAPAAPADDDDDVNDNDDDDDGFVCVRAWVLAYLSFTIRRIRFNILLIDHQLDQENECFPPFLDPDR